MTRGFKITLPVLTLLLSSLFAASDPHVTYLALGDSVSFGFNPTLLAPGSPLPTPDQFVGYPEIVENFSQRIKGEINASCPGETSGSFLNVSAPDNGCNHPHIQPDQTVLPPFKTTIGLHVPYSGSQVQYAVSYLSHNQDTKLVTLSIGGNDLLLLQAQCATDPNFAACVQSQLTSILLPAYAQNLTQILTAIRTQGRFNGNLVLVKYYSPTADPVFTQAVAALNSVMVQVGSRFDVQFADGFTAFQLASAFTQGDPCQAGLLIRLSPTVCDVHPSLAGQRVLAASVLLTGATR